MSKGFTSIELLLGMIVVSLSVTLISASLPLIKALIKEDKFIQDQIAIRQLRHILLLSEELAGSDPLTFTYLGDECSLQFDKQRLVKTPGYEIFMEALEQASFVWEGECVYLDYQREGREAKRLLACHQPRVDQSLCPDEYPTCAEPDDADDQPAADGEASDQG